MKRVLKLLTMKCDEVADLVSSGLDRDLSAFERFQVRLHLLYCSACRRYRKHLLLIRQVLSSVGDQLAESQSDVALGAEARLRITKALNRE